MTKTPLFLVLTVLLLGGVYFYMKKEAPVSNTGGTVSCSTALAEEVISVPLTCTEDLGGAMAELTVSADGSLRVTKGDDLIFANAEAEDGVGGEYMDYDGTHVRTGSIVLEDVTFDGFKDIAILYSAGAYNLTYQYYAYDPELGRFSSTHFLEATNPQVDIDAQTITDYSKGRGVGDIYVLSRHHFQGGGYELVYRESQDLVSANGDTAEGYVRVTEEMKDGALVETSRVKLSQDEVWGEAE